MELMKRLRRASLRRVLVLAIILIAAAAALFVIFDCQILFKTFAPKTLAELTPETLDGAYVEDDVYFFYGQYVEEEEYRDHRPTGKITGAQYLMDLDDVYYIGLFAHELDLEEARDLMDASYEFAMGNLSADELPVMHVKGTILPMEGEVLGYYREVAEGDAELEEVMLPYYLNVSRVGDRTTVFCWIMLALSAALLIWGLSLIIRAATGGYQKKMRAKLAECGDESAMLEKLDQFYDGTDPVCGVRMNQDFVLFQSGPESVLLRPWDVAWAYQSTTQHRTNGIPTGKTFCAVLRTMDGKQYQLSMKEPKVQELLAAIHEALPGTVMGYDKELETLYKQDRGAFAARWEEARPGCGVHG